MNLVELYAQTPVGKHDSIKVVDNKVYVRDADGSVTEYLILSDGELWLARSDKTLKADIVAIRQKVGA